MKVQSTRIKPYLTEHNKLRRIEFGLTFLEPDSLRFEPIRENPQQSHESKNNIMKTMFLAGVARPRWDPHKKEEI
ncbi:hypothetical protein PHMEG_00015493 [Phytophthora megakarya]|uniref:Uncharacterized protein n=1 Tax=Phytophthora megakarya TaxID=4795 RepID=A0A225W2P0_9STRA|nr:hypothetical protein PHMEG_00015493 [Phytophthora megakarya]